MPDETHSEQTLAAVVTGIVDRYTVELYALTETELAARWHFRWNPDATLSSNLYEFTSMLELHKGECRRWETYHHGSTCVVERVRDKYLMPRIKAFERCIVERLSQDFIGPSNT